MKNVLFALVIMSFGLVHAEGVAQGSNPSGNPSLEAGKMSKDERRAMHEQLKDEREAVVTACAEESKAANCGDKVVGKGLLKCIHQSKVESKKAGKEFKISEGCKTAMKNLKTEREKFKTKNK